MTWLDWLIVAVIVFSTLQGLRCGLLASITRLAGTLIGLGAAFAYYRPLSDYLSARWNIEEKLLPLASWLLKLFLPYTDLAPPAFPPARLAPVAVSVPGRATAIGEHLSRMFAAAALDVLSFLALLLATAWAAGFAGSLLTRIAGMTMLGPLNRLGGLLFGAVRGLAIVVVFLALLSPFQQTGLFPGGHQTEPGGPGRGSVFQDSKLLPFFEPLLKAIDRQLPGAPPGSVEPAGNFRQGGPPRMTF
ncbi:MAG: hypothetical protein HPY89_12730 [Pelotomaculum sp.]|nr:hypothetical protein [Pelotomaculum sp.]